LALAYIPSTGTDSRELTVDLSQLAGPVMAAWYNPVSGQYQTARGGPLANAGAVRLTTPGDNGSGTNDWLLVLQSTR
jgi:hypothetical protein